MASDSKSVASATVAVCTRDRPEELGRCLDGLLKMPDNGQEILVVDSCSSTDATLRLLESYSGIRYIREDRPGLNIARNRALREAKHPIVAFIDDDAVPDAQWLRSLIRNFDDPLALCVTGLTMPIELETQAQEYFEKEGGLGRGFLRMVFDAAECYPHEAGNAGVGTNMAVRSSILGLIGPFDEALDVGTATRAGGDVELLFRILSSGYRVVYEPSALNWHRHKKSWVDTRRLAYGYRVGEFSAWTRSFLFDRELEAAKAAWKWLISHLANPGEKPLDLYLLGLFGCLVGPWIYLYSRWRNRRSRQV